MYKFWKRPLTVTCIRTYIHTHTYKNSNYKRFQTHDFCASFSNFLKLLFFSFFCIVLSLHCLDKKNLFQFFSKNLEKKKKKEITCIERVKIYGRICKTKGRNKFAITRERAYFLYLLQQDFDKFQILKRNLERRL